MSELIKTVSLVGSTTCSIQNYSNILSVSVFRQFDLKRINTHSSRLSADLLEECNRLEIDVQINDPVCAQEMVRRVQEIIRKTFPKEAASLDLDDSHILKVLKQWASCRLSSLQQLVEKDFQFLWILPDVNDVKIDASVNLDKLIELLQQTEFNEDELPSVLRKFSKEHNIAIKTLMMTMRALLSGRKDGPAVHEMMAILGKKTTIERLQRLKSKAKSK